MLCVCRCGNVLRKSCLFSFADKLCKGEAQPLIPFSGKGYVLGDTSSCPLPGKLSTSYMVNEAKGLSNQDHSASGLILDSNIEVKCEQNGFPSKRPHLVSPVPTASHQSVLSSYFPRVSVANQKAFRNVNGSPVKSGTIGDGTKHSASSGSQRKVPPSRASLRNATKVMASASATVSSATVTPSTISQEESTSEDQFPNKRLRLEDRTALDNIIKEQTHSGGGDLQNNSRPPATSTVRSSSSSCSQRRLVNCPVCQNVVLESGINEHLDRCLEGNKTNLRPRRVWNRVGPIPPVGLRWCCPPGEGPVGYSLAYYTSSILFYIYTVSNCSLSPSRWCGMSV